VRARVERFERFRDVGAVLDPRAISEVASLLGAVSDLDADPEAASAAGWLHWCRYLVLDSGDDERELHAALMLFERVYVVLPGAVPGPVRDFLAGGRGPDPAREAQETAAHAVLLLQAALDSDDADGLNQPISMVRQALGIISAEHPHRPAMLSILGAALQQRFMLAGDPADAQEAVTFARLAVRDCPPGHPGRPAMLSNLGIALDARVSAGCGEPADLDEAVSALREAVKATQAGTPDRAELLVNYSAVLSRRAEIVGGPDDFNESITVAREAYGALPDDHPGRTGVLANLGVTLWQRYGRTGRREDLEEAIVFLRALADADVPGGGQARARPLSVLGVALLARFELAGGPADLDEAVTVAREAVRATSTRNPDRATWLANLGLVIEVRSEQTGSLADLDESISITRQAIAATPAGHPDQGKRLANLCASLARRSERTGALADLDEAISLVRQAVTTTLIENPDRIGMLSSLGAALARRSERAGRLADLDEAIVVAREAASQTPADHPVRPAVLANLGTTLAHRYELTHAPADLDEALAVMRDAAQATPAGHGDLPMWLANLGLALARQFERTGAPADLDQAITVGQQAVDAAPAGHPDQAEWLASLAASRRARFERTGEPADLDAVVAAARKSLAIEAGSPRARLRAAREWGWAAGSAGHWNEAVEGYEAAISLAGLVAPRSLVHRDQEHLLEQLGGLAADAAACCIRAGQTDHAVELFEQGRGILLGQVLDTRTDLTDLAREHRDLADRFAALRDSLDAAGDRSARLLMPSAGTDRETRRGASLDRLQLDQRREIAKEFDVLIAAIRSMPGFSSFLRPLPVSQLTTVAADGPIVIINVSRFGSHALIVTSDGVLEPVPLEGLTPGRVREEVTRFLAAVDDAAEQEVTEGLGWLWDAIAGPVLDRLGTTGTPQAGEPWPRLWWCVQGLLSFLPVHAAGHHETRCDLIPQTVADRVVSSYTPTIRALAYAHRPHPADSGLHGTANQLIVVAMPRTPGAGDLPGAQDEADLLRERFGNQAALLIGSQATYDLVISALPAAQWAHFACHGQTDPASPSANRLLLHDHERRPLEVTDVTRLRLEHADLAFLSACSTARPSDRPSERLADEAIHLASAFQLAGYRHVIGTLWPISDAQAVQLANDVYSVLASTGTAAAAPSALHMVTRRMRDRWQRAPSVWASHIHVGA